ncbi:MAG: hypothetical protein ABI480_18125, partial [Chitinophagaceae bacterium]
MKQFISISILLLSLGTVRSQSYHLAAQEDRWKIQADGSIAWQIDKRLPHNDHTEMSGEKVSLWVQYGVDTAGRSSLDRTLVFPTFRLLPQRTVS